MQKENNYSVGSGAEITCARLGFENYQILAAGDDQKNVIVWKITRTKPRLVSTFNFEFNYFRLSPDIQQMFAALVLIPTLSTFLLEPRVVQCTLGTCRVKRQTSSKGTRLPSQASHMRNRAILLPLLRWIRM